MSFAGEVWWFEALLLVPGLVLISALSLNFGHFALDKS